MPKRQTSRIFPWSQNRWHFRLQGTCNRKCERHKVSCGKNGERCQRAFVGLGTRYWYQTGNPQQAIRRLFEGIESLLCSCTWKLPGPQHRRRLGLYWVHPQDITLVAAMLLSSMIAGHDTARVLVVVDLVRAVCTMSETFGFGHKAGNGGA